MREMSPRTFHANLGLEGTSAEYLSSYVDDGGGIPENVSCDIIAKVAGRIEKMAWGLGPSHGRGTRLRWVPLRADPPCRRRRAETCSPRANDMIDRGRDANRTAQLFRVTLRRSNDSVALA